MSTKIDKLAHNKPLIVDIGMQTYQKWRDDRTIRLGAGLAYYGVFAIIPVLVLMITFAASFFSSEQVHNFVHNFLTTIFGDSLNEAIQQLSSKAAERTTSINFSSLGFLGVASLFISASFIFIALQDALDVIWNNSAHRGIRRSVRRYLMAYGVVLLSSSLLFLALIVNTMSSVAKYIIPGNIELLESLADLVVVFGSWTFGILVVAIIFKALIYADVSWKVLLVSSTLTSVLIVIGTWLLGIYLSNVGVASLGGAIGGFFVLLLWIYYEAQIFLLGAQLTYVLSANKSKIKLAGFTLG